MFNYLEFLRKKPTTLASLLLASPTIIPPATAHATGFIDDSLLPGTLYYWQRHRERKDMRRDSAHYGQYQTNLHHGTTTVRLDYQSGFIDDFIGVDIGGFASFDLF